MQKKIAIIGAGISGLSTAFMLLNKSYNITIYAKAFSPNITSNKAAAFWFPYHVRNDKRGIQWCQLSYDFYKQLAADPSTGISMKQLLKVIRKGIVEEDTVWMDFMPEGSWRFMYDTELQPGIARGYNALVPLIETQIFLPFLENNLRQNGVVFFEKEINNFDEITALYDIVINCAGLGAKELCNDNALIPVRGQVALLSPKHDLPIYLDNEMPLYIVPRKDAIIIGGTYEDGETIAETDPSTIARLLGNAYTVFPQLMLQQVIGSWAGLRPFRPVVRLEKEAGKNIIHNYGHGGNGFSLAFGCANEVKGLVEKMIIDK